MQIKELIREKREGRELDRETLEKFLKGYLKGEVQDYQMAAWLMAVFFRGMTWQETSHLTEIMWKSGVTFQRKRQDEFWIDKHSTGGVGDKTSLILVPLVTSVCRRVFGEGKVKLPMVSGRGLGHTGGTLDKLESVPKFSPGLAIPKAMELLEKHGFFMMGQTSDLAPLDRLLYALRDATATVESIPLIVSSIMSKKLSENLNGLVFDVKVGAGAFMKTEGIARELAGGLMAVAKIQNVKGIAILTDMDEPLGLSAGNALEVEECWNYIRGEARDPGLHEVTSTLAGAMVSLASQGKLSLEKARRECEEELSRPDTRQLFQQMFENQGGDWNLFLSHRGEARAKLQRLEWRATKDGYLSRVDALGVGELVNALGGGRNRKEDLVDPEVGLEIKKKVGSAVKKDETLMVVYYREPSQKEFIEKRLAKSTEIISAPVPSTAWVREIIV